MQKLRLPLWALAWIALVLLALVVLLGNQPAVDRILQATGLESVLYPGGKSAPPVQINPTPPVATVLVEPRLAPSPAVATDPVVAEPNVGEPAVTEEPTAEPPLPDTPNTYRLYFLKLSPEGRLEASGFVRELPAGTTPLSATIKALLLGPTLQDKAQGALTMVPEGTKLLSIRIRGRTAVISFSEEFERNVAGAEGLAGQLREVVWTATQFESVDDVQILIMGQVRDTLGESDLRISDPLSRKSVP